MPDAIGSISFSYASFPSRLFAKEASVSSSPLPFGAKISPIIRSLPDRLRRFDLKKAAGDSGRRWSFPSEKMNLFRALSLLRSGVNASFETSSRVFGLLSRNPFTPPSQRKPLTLSVHILPPAFFSDSRTTMSKEGFFSRRKYARERPVIPPPMITSFIFLA